MPVGQPLGRLSTSGAQYPFANRYNQAGFFRQRNEVRRRDQAQFWMLPADQCFDRTNAATLGIDLGLIPSESKAGLCSLQFVISFLQIPNQPVKIEQPAYKV